MTAMNSVRETISCYVSNQVRGDIFEMRDEIWNNHLVLSLGFTPFFNILVIYRRASVPGGRSQCQTGLCKQLTPS